MCERGCHRGRIEPLNFLTFLIGGLALWALVDLLFTVFGG